MNKYLFRNESQNLHREGLPAVDLPGLKQYFWNGKLHNSRGPAVETSSGTRAYYWKGIFIEKSLWDRCSSISAEEILGISNAELRRCILEKAGYDRFLDKAVLLDSYQENKLYKLDLSGDEPVVFLRLVNSTPEPDGTRKIYFLRVPPNYTDCKKAIGWTLEVSDNEDYTYLFES